MLHAFLLILVGLAGDPEHGELFHKWGGELAEFIDGFGLEFCVLHWGTLLR